MLLVSRDYFWTWCIFWSSGVICGYSLSRREHHLMNKGTTEQRKIQFYPNPTSKDSKVLYIEVQVIPFVLYLSIMEIANDKQGGFVKSMLVMSFYRSNKPPPSANYATTVVKQKPSSSVQKVSSNAKPGGIPCYDGYVHGPSGVGGDEHVDNKATSYISQVKERVKREEMSIINGSAEETYKSLLK